MITDRIAGLELSVPIGVSEPLSSEANRSGDLSDRAVMLSRDMDGDGLAELLVGVDEVDYAAHNSGAVYLYRGTEAGVAEVPERVFATDDKDVQAGRSIATGDFDGDGALDLAIGVPFADPGVNNGGVVRIHAGKAGALPELSPTQLLGGAFADDNLGQALAACDFNADGVDDLVATAQRGENRALLKPFTDQGALYVYLGHQGEGLSSEPDQIIYGHVLAEGELVQRVSLRLGLRASAGDFDGDGACDLAASTINWSFGENAPNREDGGVFLYRGKHAEPGVEGGLETTPSRVWAANNEDATRTQFGVGLLMADLNGDGFADVVANQSGHKNPDKGGNNHGAVNAFSGGPLANQVPAEPVPVEEADWHVQGQDPSSGFGSVLLFEDIGSDGVPDLIVGAPMGRDSGGLRAGLLHVFQSPEGEGPGTEEDFTVPGWEAEARLGTAVAVVGGELAVMVSRDDSFGMDVGRPYVLEEAEPRGLDMPGLGTGDGFGSAVVIIRDLTGDDIEDLVVGAPFEDVPGLGTNAGIVSIYRGTSDGFELQPAATLKGFRTHAAEDRFGTAVYDLGDVDGDGRGDLGVRSVLKAVPGIGAFGDGLASVGACDYGGPNVGALYVFRGTDDGAPQAEPAFIVYGLKAGSRLDDALGALDVNGDGHDDIVAGNPTYDVPAEPERDENGELVPVANQGAVAVYLGQPAAGDGTTIVLCSPSGVITGQQNGGRFGARLAALGDLDGDGCSDFAVSAPFEEYSELLEGAIHVVRGWGGLACPLEPMVSTFAPGIVSAQSGTQMTGGADVDGDGVPDVVFSNATFVSGGARVGAVWLLSGAYAASVSPTSVAGWAPEDVQPMWPKEVNAQAYRVLGATKDARFGASLALFSSAEQSNAHVLVGATRSAASGAVGGGGAYLLGFTAGAGFEAIPRATFSGESARLQSKLGHAVSTGYVDGRPMMAVGGPGASSVVVDNGAAYALDMSP